jgi:hypothetical protein
MAVLEWTLALLLGAVLLAALARRIGAPSPALLALGGVAVALLPNGPHFSLDPDLALALFVAPVLLDAAFDSSLRDLRANWFPVTRNSQSEALWLFDAGWRGWFRAPARPSARARLSRGHPHWGLRRSLRRKTARPQSVGQTRSKRSIAPTRPLAAKNVQLMTEGEVLQFHNRPTAESAGKHRGRGNARA